MVPLFPPELLDLPTFPGISVEPEEARTILRPQRDEALGFGFALSPYRGCVHGCKFCYLREYAHPRHSLSDWGTWVAPKLNAPELLWKARHRLHDQTVFLSTGTDPYQPLEKHLGLTRACLEVLQKCPSTRVIVHTRSPLVLRDLNLLRAFGSRLSVGLSIPTDDDTVRQILEPKAPAIPSRWAAAERLVQAGIQVQVAVTPLLPMVDPEAFGRRLHDSGVQKVWVGRLRLLKDDPMAVILSTHGWLKALQPEYAHQVEAILQSALPRACRLTKRRKCLVGDSPGLPDRPTLRLHPGLFDAGIA